MAPPTAHLRVLILINDVALVVHDIVDRSGLAGWGDDRLTHLGGQPGGGTGEVAHVLAPLGHSGATNALRAA